MTKYDSNFQEISQPRHVHNVEFGVSFGNSFLEIAIIIQIAEVLVIIEYT